MGITRLQVQILLHKCKVEQTEVITMLLFSFVTHKFHEHLAGTFALS